MFKCLLSFFHMQDCKFYEESLSTLFNAIYLPYLRLRTMSENYQEFIKCLLMESMNDSSRFQVKLFINIITCNLHNNAIK